MTPSELKANYLEHNPDGHFFDRSTMKFFGDTMKNYGVRKIESNGVQYWELYRKRPVKHGVIKSVYFTVDTFEYLTRI